MTRQSLSVVATAAALLAAAFHAAAAGPLMHAGHRAHELDRLGRTGRVLYVAAHPDDESTRLMAYLANGRHLATAYLSMTRGGGGQNPIGAEPGDLLDAIRTEELPAARRTDGARQRFTRMRDFGYSKSAAETLAPWDHDQALADVVWVIRTFQPDVIITRFDEQPPNHGHHTASAILAREATMVVNRHAAEVALCLVPLEIAPAAGPIGYIPGSGDSVGEDLAHVGASVAVLDEETVGGGDLSRFAAIVVGIRAYNTHPFLKRFGPAAARACSPRADLLVSKACTRHRARAVRGRGLVVVVSAVLEALGAGSGRGARAVRS